MNVNTTNVDPAEPQGAVLPAATIGVVAGALLGLASLLGGWVGVALAVVGATAVLRLRHGLVALGALLVTGGLTGVIPLAIVVHGSHACSAGEGNCYSSETVPGLAVYALAVVLGGVVLVAARTRRDTGNRLSQAAK